MNNCRHFHYDYASTALPWLQGRISVDAIAKLVDAWELFAVFDGKRVTLADTDGDGLSDRTELCVSGTDHLVADSDGGGATVGGYLAEFDPRDNVKSLLKFPEWTYDVFSYDDLDRLTG